MDQMGFKFIGIVQGEKTASLNVLNNQSNGRINPDLLGEKQSKLFWEIHDLH